MPSARRFTIKGRVQGVFFRDSTRRVAESLGITGYARNLPDGDVEVFACGELSAISEMAAWLEDGPRMATVTSVTMQEIETDEPTGFVTG